jgi:hypothetical protein
MICHWQYHGAHSWLFDEPAIRDSCQRQILSIDLKEGLVSQVNRKERKIRKKGLGNGGIGSRATTSHQSTRNQG